MPLRSSNAPSAQTPAPSPSSNQGACGEPSTIDSTTMSRPLAAAPPKADILRGWIKTTKDAILVFEATRVGIVPRVTRRFHDLEKRSIIQSGAILVFTEEESGIKRWTDPFLWSASRMQGNFLVRELVGYRAILQPV